MACFLKESINPQRRLIDQYRYFFFFVNFRLVGRSFLLSQKVGKMHRIYVQDFFVWMFLKNATSLPANTMFYLNFCIDMCGIAFLIVRKRRILWQMCVCKDTQRSRNTM